MRPRPITEPGADPGRFTLTPLPGQDRGQLRFHGRDAGTMDGIDLVAHFPVDGVGWLLVTDCDCPYEETVFIHLLGPGLARLAQQSLGGMYVPGIVDTVEQTGPLSFRIAFPGPADRQRVTVETRAGLWQRGPRLRITYG